MSEAAPSTGPGNAQDRVAEIRRVLAANELATEAELHAICAAARQRGGECLVLEGPPAHRCGSANEQPYHRLDLAICGLGIPSTEWHEILGSCGWARSPVRGRYGWRKDRFRLALFLSDFGPPEVERELWGRYWVEACGSSAAVGAGWVPSPGALLFYCALSANQPGTEGLEARLELASRGSDKAAAAEGAAIGRRIGCDLSSLPAVSRPDPPLPADHEARNDELTTTRLDGLQLEIPFGVFGPTEGTRLLIQVADEALRGVGAPVVVDVGTGSGAVALAIAARRPDAIVYGTDIESVAVRAAQRNAALNGLEADFRRGSLLDPVLPSVDSVDLVVASTPFYAPWQLYEGPADLRSSYIGTAPDGLGLLRETARSASELGSKVVLQAARTQGPEVRTLLRGHGYHAIDIVTPSDSSDTCVVLANGRPTP